MDIGSKNKNARAGANLTQGQAAEALGVSRQTISNWENEGTMYKSEIRHSQLNKLSDKCRKLNYGEYLCKVGLVKCRAFVNQLITFDFPVTALIGPNGGGKTTILGACALIYDTVSSRQFFARNRQLDQEMKDWSITPAGAQSSAVIYSLIETAKETGLDPYRYLLWELRSAPALSQTDESWAEKLLPARAPQECRIPQSSLVFHKQYLRFCFNFVGGNRDACFMFVFAPFYYFLHVPGSRWL